MERLNRWMYQRGKPNALAGRLNSLSAWLYRQSWTPSMLDVLETTGRNTGNEITLPIVVVHHGSERYLVSMLGNNTNWVKNVRAAEGSAALLKGGRSDVTLEETPAGDRSPILKRYCEIAPGGRSHIPVDTDASPEELAAIAADFPVFRVIAE